MQWGRKTKHFLQTVGLLFEDVGQSSIGRVEIESDKRERERRQICKESAPHDSYLRSCACGTDVIGQTSRSPCSPWSTALHLRRQQKVAEALL